MLMLSTKMAVSTTSGTTVGSVCLVEPQILVLVLITLSGQLEKTKRVVDLVSTNSTIAQINGVKSQDLVSELMLIRMAMLGLLTTKRKSTITMVKNGSDNQVQLMILVLVPTELFGQLERTKLVVDLVSTERLLVHTPLNGLPCLNKVLIGDKMSNLNWFNMKTGLQSKVTAK